MNRVHTNHDGCKEKLTDQAIKGYGLLSNLLLLFLIAHFPPPHPTHTVDPPSKTTCSITNHDLVRPEISWRRFRFIIPSNYMYFTLL